MIYSYRRVSTDEQHNGPQAQADAIKRWLQHKDPTITADENVFGAQDFFDDGVSGSVPLFERPEGCKLGDRIEQDEEPPTIVVAKLDRLFRSVADAATTMAHWSKIGVTLVAIAEGFDMTNPYGKAMAQMASVFAELEREMIRSRTKAALAAKKARGECVGEVPYGYEIKTATGHFFGGQKVLVKCHDEQEVINGMETLVNNGMTAKQIAAHLNSYGVTAKKGGRWHATQVRRIIEAEKLRRDCDGVS